MVPKNVVVHKMHALWIHCCVLFHHLLRCQFVKCMSWLLSSLHFVEAHSLNKKSSILLVVADTLREELFFSVYNGTNMKYM